MRFASIAVCRAGLRQPHLRLDDRRFDVGRARDGPVRHVLAAGAVCCRNHATSRAVPTTCRRSGQARGDGSVRWPRRHDHAVRQVVGVHPASSTHSRARKRGSSLWNA